MNVFQIHPHDNVAVAVDAVAQGSVVTAGGKTFTVCQDIPAGHKVALQPIAKGEDVIKYGFPIGTAKVDIPVGAWVHTQNVQSKLGDLLHYTYEPEKADRSPWKCEKNTNFSAIRGQMAVPASATKSGSSRPSAVSTTLPGPLRRLRKAIKQKISMASMPIVIPTAARN